MSPSGCFSATSEAWLQLSPLKEGLGRGTVHEGLIVVVGPGYTNKQKKDIFLYLIFFAPGLISCLPLICPHYGASGEGGAHAFSLFSCLLLSLSQPLPFVVPFLWEPGEGETDYSFLGYITRCATRLELCLKIHGCIILFLFWTLSSRVFLAL